MLNKWKVRSTSNDVIVFDDMSGRVLPEEEPGATVPTLHFGGVTHWFLYCTIRSETSFGQELRMSWKEVT